MSRSDQKKTEAKSDTRKPSAEHLASIERADRAALEAQAIVGRGFLELVGLAQRAHAAGEAQKQARVKAAISVAIDPDGCEPWGWDAERGEFKKGS